MYNRLEPSDSLTQGEIIDGCPLVYWSRGNTSLRWEVTESMARVILLTQACDLANAKTTRVQVAIVHQSERLVQAGILKPQTIEDQLVRHRVFGWYFLPAGPELLESIVDLRDIHTIERGLLEELATEGKRICAMETPYREHLAQHFAVTFSRIGLPEPYQTEA